MATNSFSCPICGCNTRHIEVTLAEAGAATGGGRLFKVLNGFNDLTGANKTMQFLSGKRCWKCENCTSIFLRDTSGEIQEILKQGEPNKKSEEIVYIPQTIIDILINSTTINNYYLSTNSDSNSDYPWLHKQQGYIGRGLDLYKIVLYGDKIPSFEQRKGLANTLLKLNLGLGTRENILWKLSPGKNKLEWAVTKEQAIEIYNKLRDTFLIDYIKID